MATVWRATDDVLSRDVAVKVLSPQHAADASFVARFGREAKNIAAVSSSRIVTVYDCGVDGTTPYIVMELVSGRTLKQVLDEVGKLSVAESIRIAAAVCEALEAAHAARLVHRDIKPANIVLSGREVKVLDFGIARAQFPAGGTRTLGVLGTAAYLSPEQASGHPVGPQSDLYSLGCVLYEMLTGTPPLTADSDVGIAYRHVHDDPGPPSAHCSGLPDQVDWITMQLLAKKPGDRPAGAAAARASLLGCLAPDRTNVFAAPPGSGVVHTAPRRIGEWRTSETMLAMSLIAAMAALAVVWLTGSVRTAASSVPPTHQATRRQTSPASAPASSGSTTPAPQAGRLPPTARAGGALVAELLAGMADGQVSQQAEQNTFSQLQQLLVNTPRQNAEQVEQQYAQLIEVFDQYRSQGQISGPTAVKLRQEISALGAALGAG